MGQSVTQDRSDRNDAAQRLALNGVSVVEAGQGVAAAFAAKLMALLGAAVIKVEPPGGDVTRRRGPFPGDMPDPENSGLFRYLNAGKRGVVLDLSDARGRADMDALIAGADILIHNVPPYERAACGLDSGALTTNHPRLIVAAISAYGGFGPRANYRAYEINAMHSSGMAILSPRLSDRPDLPPLKPFGQQAEFQGGLHAAAAVLAAYWQRMKSGAGQAIDVSEQECIAAALELSLVWYTYEGKRTSRMGWVNSAPTGIFHCADGMAELGCVEDAQWHRLAKFMGKPEWLDEEIFQGRQTRVKNSDAVNALVQAAVADRRMLDVVRGLQDVRVPAAPVSTMADLYNDAHLKSREFFVALPARAGDVSPVPAPGVPFKSTAMGWSMRTPAPRLGEHTREVMAAIAARAAALNASAEPDSRAGVPARHSAGPLSGVRVLDFSWVWAGPFCTLQLAHLGAEVIRVETSKRPCINRIIPPYAEGKAGINRAGSFNQWNQGKRSLQLDLSQPQAAQIARQLARHCDVAVENFAPGVIDRFGVGYPALRAVKPDLIMLSISGYGQTGPYARFVSYGLMIASHCGLHSVSSYEHDGPRELGISYPDPTTGIFGAGLIGAALIHRDRTGQGQHIDLSMLEAMRNGHARGAARVRDQWARAAAVGQPRSLDGAAQLLQDPRRRRALGDNRGGHGRRMACAMRRDRPAARWPMTPAFATPRRASKTKTGAGPDHHRMDPGARPLGDNRITPTRRRRGDSHLHQRGRRQRPPHARARIPGRAAAPRNRSIHPRRRPVDDVANAVQGTPRRPPPGRRHRLRAERNPGLPARQDRGTARYRYHLLTSPASASRRPGTSEPRFLSVSAGLPVPFNPKNTVGSGGIRHTEACRAPEPTLRSSTT